MNHSYYTSILLLPGVAITSCVFCTAAQAQQTAAKSLDDLTPEERAVFFKYLASARDLVEQGNHRDAIDFMERAQAIFPHPKIPIRLAESYEALGDDERAAKIYEEFIQTAPTPEERSEAETKLTAVNARLAQTKEALEKEVFELALPRAQHIITQAQDIASMMPKTPVATADDTVTQKNQQTITTTPIPPEQKPSTRKKIPAISWVFAGGSVLAGAAAGGLIYLRIQNDEQIDQTIANAPNQPRPPQLDEQVTASARYNTLALTSTIISGVALTGAVLSWRLHKSHEQSSSLTFHPWGSHHGAGFSLNMNF